MCSSDLGLASAGAFEDRLHGRRVFSSADEIGAGPAADEQIQRLDEHGFAGAGFSGEHGETRLEVDFELIDNRKMPDAEITQHVDRKSNAIKPFGVVRARVLLCEAFALFPAAPFRQTMNFGTTAFD